MFTIIFLDFEEKKVISKRGEERKNSKARKRKTMYLAYLSVSMGHN